MEKKVLQTIVPKMSMCCVHCAPRYYTEPCAMLTYEGTLTLVEQVTKTLQAIRDENRRASPNTLFGLEEAHVRTCQSFRDKFLSGKGKFVLHYHQITSTKGANGDTVFTYSKDPVAVQKDGFAIYGGPLHCIECKVWGRKKKSAKRERKKGNKRRK